MIAKVIGGAQTGVDEIALWVARRAGIPTGGTIARGCLTERGPRPDLLAKYGLVECDRDGYPARTARNIRDADATLVLAYDPGSAGTRLAVTLAARLRRPLLLIDMNGPVAPGHAAGWIRAIAEEKGRPIRLNVGGNRGSTMTDDQKRSVATFLTNLFSAGD